MDDLFRLLFNGEVIREALPQLLREGLRITLIVSVGAIAVWLVFGLGLSLVAISRNPLLRLPAIVYIDIFRGLPAILTIFIIGFGLPTAGFRPFGRNPIAYGTLALGLISTAYCAEIFRSGIQGVDKGQMEAARSLGMRRLQALRLVVVPQGIRRVLPPLTNEFIAITKDSALVFVLGSTVGSRELTRIAQNVAQSTGNTSAYVAAGLVYLAITIPLTRIVNFMDRRLREGRPRGVEELPASAGIHQ